MSDMANTPKKVGLLGTRNKQISPDDISLLRQEVYSIVEKNLERASQVLEGSVSWNGNQVRLYLAMMDKVLPAQSEKLSVHEHKHDITELSKEELLKLILEERAKQEAKSSLEKSKVIEGEIISEGEPLPETFMNTPMNPPEELTRKQPS